MRTFNEYISNDKDQDVNESGFDRILRAMSLSPDDSMDESYGSLEPERTGKYTKFKVLGKREGGMIIDANDYYNGIYKVKIAYKGKSVTGMVTYNHPGNSVVQQYLDAYYRGDPGNNLPRPKPRTIGWGNDILRFAKESGLLDDKPALIELFYLALDCFMEYGDRSRIRKSTYTPGLGADTVRNLDRRSAIQWRNQARW